MMDSKGGNARHAFYDSADEHARLVERCRYIIGDSSAYGMMSVEELQRRSVATRLGDAAVAGKPPAFVKVAFNTLFPDTATKLDVQSAKPEAPVPHYMLNDTEFAAAQGRAAASRAVLKDRMMNAWKSPQQLADDRATAGQDYKTRMSNAWKNP